MDHTFSPESQHELTLPLANNEAAPTSVRELAPESSEVYTPAQRSNLLALEKIDCHLCMKRGRKCDRQRRQCKVCEENGDICGGYPIFLRWQNEERKSSKRSRKSATSETGPVGQAGRFRQAFIFVDHRKRQLRRKNKVSGSKDQPLPNQGSERASVAFGSRTVSVSRGLSGSPQIDDIQLQTSFPVVETPKEPLEEVSGTEHDDSAAWTMPEVGLGGLAPPDFEDLSSDIFVSNEPLEEMSGTENDDSAAWTMPEVFLGGLAPPDFEDLFSDVFVSQDLSDTPGSDLHQALLSQTVDEDLALSIHGTVEGPTWEFDSIGNPQLETVPCRLPVAPNLMQKYQFSSLLNMYDQVYCILPVTMDMTTNPFRCRKETSLGSPSLLHAILALSNYHLGKTTNQPDLDPEVVNHKDTAIALYRNTLIGLEKQSAGLHLLDTAIVLFALNATQSAFGNWNEQLEMVSSLLKAFGGATALEQSSRVRAQVAMFMWWDTTISIISRKARIIPTEYFEALSVAPTQNTWTFFNLVGCPSSLVQYLVELSDLTAEFEATRGKRWTKFDPKQVLEIEKALRNWSGYKSPDIDTQVNDEDDEASMHHKQDIYHCAEAWKNALLIYILRIFKTEQLSAPAYRLQYLSRVILDHVRNCRKSSYIQKQLLLPVYLAGCETSDDEARQFASDYCNWWNEKSSYGMFSSVGSLMEALWKRQQEANGQNAWWGKIIDEKLAMYDQPPNSFQCLLG